MSASSPGAPGCRGYVVSHTDEEGLTNIIYPTGSITSIQYQANDTRMQMTDRRGTTLWVYRARDEVLQVNAPQGSVVDEPGWTFRFRVRLRAQAPDRVRR